MYYLLLILLYPLALLPLRVVYLWSDFVFLIIYYVLGYRKAVVMDNLRHAFPEKTEQELHIIAKKFYRNFCDQWIETMKLLTLSEKELNRRMTGNWEVFHELQKEGLNTYALLGHTFNWEWANVVCQYNVKQQFVGFYMPVTSKGFDKLMQKLRKSSGAWLISMHAKKAIQKLQTVQYIVGLIADQNPSNLKQSAWLPFMHRTAPFFKGPGQLARRAGAAVVFAGIKKIKRGHYHVNLQLLTKDARQLQEGELLTKYIAFMEQQLREQPDNWLWSHRRWKYNKADFIA